jgi:hypothetical protein
MTKKHYSSDEIHKKNVEKRIQEIQNIKIDFPEPRENREVIDGYFSEKKKDKVWDNRRKNDR